MKKRKILFDFLTVKEMGNVSSSTASGEEETEPGCDPTCEYYCSNSGGCLAGSDALGKPVKYLCAISKTISR